MATPAKVSNRQIRKAVNAQAGVMETHHETLRALVNDELKTRGRVDALEAFRDMGFRDRVRWFVRGYRG